MDEYPAGYDWDPAKNRRNLATHGLTFASAASAFEDEKAVVEFDTLHSHWEVRERLIGSTEQGAIVVVAFTERGTNIRIISARPATPQERRRYEANSRRRQRGGG